MGGFSIPARGFGGLGGGITGLILDGVVTAIALSPAAELLSKNKYVQAFSKALQAVPFAGFWLINTVETEDLGSKGFANWTNLVGIAGGAAIIALPLALAATRHWAQKNDYKKLDFCLAIIQKINSISIKAFSVFSLWLLAALATGGPTAPITIIFYNSLMAAQFACLTIQVMKSITNGVKLTVDVVRPLFASNNLN